MDFLDMFICWNDILSMGDAGFMLDFVKFLNAKSFEVREMATEALSGMVIVPRNRKGNKIFLISILMPLTSSTSGRKKIVSSGYAKNIEKLVDAEVSFDANRLVKKLSTNRFHNLLTGIWHSKAMSFGYSYFLVVNEQCEHVAIANCSYHVARELLKIREQK
ncbi:hypothetical protein HKD37_15G044082 [Glycine soja]